MVNLIIGLMLGFTAGIVIGLYIYLTDKKQVNDYKEMMCNQNKLFCEGKCFKCSWGDRK